MNIKESRTIYNAKAIAIICVITAHTSFNNDAEIISNVIGRIGAMGVPVFLFLSGYLFHANNNSKMGLLMFMKRKIKTIFVPWIFCGVCVYLYSNIRMGNEITMIDLVLFCIGKGSYLYYMTVLIICYVIYYYPLKYKNNLILYISIGISIVSQLLTAFGIVDAIGNYLNVFNWVGFFALGVLIQSIGLNKLTDFISRYNIQLLGAWIILFIIGVLIENKTSGYFSYLGYPMECISGMLIIWFASVINNKFFEWIGKVSYSVYLLHMPIVPITYKYLSNIIVVNYVMPIVTLLLTACIILICDWITKKVSLNKVYRVLIGMR